jgi:tripartite-type tricarboxylate transporter receptor subunit TctC
MEALMRRAICSFVSTVAVLFATVAFAQNYPTRPITMVVPFAAGGSFDALGRVLAPRMSEVLGQQVVVENVTGASGVIGVNRVVGAEPDGYTILLASIGTHGYNPSIFRKLPYDPVGDFTPVALVAEQPMVLVARKDLPVANLQEFIAYAKANHAKMQFGSAGVGSTTHLTAERFRLSAGFPAVHVPFRGGGFQPELIAGRVDFGYSPIATSLPNIKEGRLQALAVSSPKRASALPDVPTTLEAGYANSDYVIWVGLFFPSKTPRAIVERMNHEMKKAWDNPALRERLTGLDVSPMPMTPAEFDALIKHDIAANAELAKAAGLQPN